jgi:PiT family inorganic phosphate transporter
MFGISTGMLIILIITIIFGFYMAWTIGANDVANSMGTVFGSGTLSLKKIIIIAAVFEFLGAFLVGAHVTKTIKGGIVDPKFFSPDGVTLSSGEIIYYYSGNTGHYVFIAGMLAVLLSAALWVTLATYKSLPISTSQSIVGAVAGFGIATVFLGEIPLRAMNGWMLLQIGAGWIISPIFGGLLAFFLFFIIRKLIFNAEEPLKRAEQLISVFIFLVFFILIFAAMSGGLKNLEDVLLANFGSYEHYIDLLLNNLIARLVIASVIGVVAALVGDIIIRRSKRLKGLESYDRIEAMFGMLLILTACYVCFAHGANDVANAIGPIAAIWCIIFDESLATTVEINPIILVIGGAGIVAGVTTWGYKVMTTVGKKITRITPTRGFSASFGAATSVLLCSMLGIPVSTSQIIVGCVIGVGLAGGLTALDLRVVRNIIVSWVITIPVAAITTIVIYLIFRGIMTII